MRVLVSAFACAPGRGSEPGIGWELVRAVAERHDVWVLTSKANQAVHDGDRTPLPRVSFVYLRAWPDGVTWAGWSVLHQILYAFWQLRAFLLARRLHRAVGFDLAHHATYGSSWMPTFLGHLGIPFVWSAGLREETPIAFYRTMSSRGILDEVVRSIALFASRFTTLELSARRARVVLSASEATRWPRFAHHQHMAIGGLSTEDAEALSKILPREAAPFRIASVGRLLGWKGVSLALEAFSRFLRRHPGSEFWIVGDGPERRYLSRQAVGLGCQGSVRFLGWRPRTDLPSLFSQIDVLVHPSIHEQFGYVVLEAMAAARPVIALNVAGPACLLRHGGGVLIDLESPAKVVSGFYVALQRLAEDPQRRLALAKEARSIALTDWTWERTGRRILTVYEEARRS